MTLRAPRRELAVVVVLCAAGAVMALIAARQGWTVEVVERPAPVPDERVVRDGGELLPWLPGLGWVALAGAGALIALRGRWRRAVGGLLVAVGAGLVAGAGAGVTGPGGGVWPAWCAVGGVAVAAAGVLAVWRGRRWPAMGARYERAGSRKSGVPADQNGHSGPTGRSAEGTVGDTPRGDTPEALSPEQIWQALDRGEDPTS
jgi:hypothetical protein